MRKIAVICTALLFTAGSAWAGAKDKSSNTLVEITPAGVIDNVTGKTKTKSKDCTLQIQAKPVVLADGEMVICIAEADVVGVGGNSILIAGEAKAGQLKIKAPMGEASFAGLGCGDIQAISYNGNMRCYKDDAAYRTGGWATACTGAGMLAGVGGTTMLKANDTQPIMIGLCQGLTIGLRIPGPPSVEFMRQGQRTAVIP
ncbi:MAG: hypothetical protein ACRERC_09910 [Candidatus Binatia bacterium]